ncbi:MAG: hypothetical protein Fues2KO_48550 [Fuerstiella sp.]
MIGNSLFLASRSLWWYRGRAAIVVLCIALTFWLPVTVRLLLNQFREDINRRAAATPLVIGAKGSRIDLALNALYFDTVAPDQTTMAEAFYVDDSGFATAMPLHTVYRTQSVNGVTGVPVVGATIEYFEFRGLQIVEGHGLAMLGDCIVGSNVAADMNLQPGDRILSAPKNAFNLAGDYPLKMNVAGILAPTFSPDDDVIFVDLKTTWIIDGIGHGHQKLDNEEESGGKLLQRDDSSVTASAAVLPYTEITDDNIASFHFHGDEENYPVSAVLAAPPTRKDQTLLLGRYASVRTETAQCVKPTEVVDDLMTIVFRVEQLVWVSSLVSTVVTGLLLVLVIALSVRLRQSEMMTMFKLGCSRGTVAVVLGMEVALMVAVGAAIAAGLAYSSTQLFRESLRSLLF